MKVSVKFLYFSQLEGKAESCKLWGTIKFIQYGNKGKDED